MPYIVNNKFQEIRKAAKNGNEKARLVIQAMRKMSPQADIDRLMEDYYNIPTVEPIDGEMPEMNKIKPQTEPTVEVISDVNSEDIHTVVDMDKTLDDETKDLFDENEIKDISFSEYLSGKSKNALRLKKNADYFKIYDPKSREEYLNKRINSYKEKFDGKLGEIYRKNKDIDKSLDKYTQYTNDYLDDDKDLNVADVDEAYNKFISNNTVMSSFGRYWDEEDVKTIVQGLAELIEHYGKRNVLAVLNALRNDNDEYVKYLNGQVDTEIGRYTKSLENVLR